MILPASVWFACPSQTRVQAWLPLLLPASLWSKAHGKSMATFAGSGSGHCDGSRFPVRPGDVVAFPPGSAHGIDNAADTRMYTVEVRLNDCFQHTTL